MFLYIGFAIGKFPSKLETGFLLGLGGISIVITSLLCSMGIISYLDIGFTMISA